MSEPAAKRPITERRRRIFLETLARTGSVCAAAAAATPHSRGKKGGLSSFRNLIARDPRFAQAVAEARVAALGRVEAEIARRAVEGVQRPVFQRGELVGFEQVYSDHLILALARRLAPEDWTERRQLEVEGRLEHRHVGVMLSVEPADVLLLDEADQETFVRLLQRIAEARDGPDVRALPPAAEVQD